MDKSESKRPLARSNRKWENNIKMDPQEIGCGGAGFYWLRIGTGGGPM
jgi:hypothetical protein